MPSQKKPGPNIVQLETALKQFGAEGVFTMFALMNFLVEQNVVERSALIAYLRRVASKYEGQWQAATMKTFYEQLELLPSATDVPN